MFNFWVQNYNIFANKSKPKRNKKRLKRNKYENFLYLCPQNTIDYV